MIEDRDADRRPVAAIFRQNLFRVSEPFITAQATGLRRYRPLYLGRLRFGPAPPGAEILSLGDLPRHRAWPAIVRQMLTRSAVPFEALLGPIRPALVHAHFGTDAVHALPLAKRLSVPLVTTFHGFDATLSTAALLASPAWMNYPLFRRALAREGALFLCVSSFIRDQVLRQGFPSDRTRIHYTGIDCDRIRPREADEETMTVLQVGRLVEMKGTRDAIDAFARIAPIHPTLRLVIVGEGPLRTGLESRARRTGFGERIVFLGARPHEDVLRLMREAAVLVLPSVVTGSGRTEGLGMVLLEAAATGVPVVASAVGGAPEGVRDGETGRLVPPREPEALAAALTDLLADTGLRRRMGEKGRRFVETRFEAGRLGRKLERYYDEARAMPRLADRTSRA